MGWYQQAQADALKGAWNLETDFVQVGLFVSTYTQDPVNENFYSNISASALTVTGYDNSFNAAGQRLAAASVNRLEPGAPTVVNLTGTDQLYSSLGAGETIGTVALWVAKTTAADSPLLVASTVTPVPTNGSDVEVQWNSDGVLRMTRA